MNVLETVLNFLTQLARIIFPRKRKPAAGDCSCPDPYPRPLPDGDHPTVSPDAANGSNPDRNRSDTLALRQGDWGTRSNIQPIDITGYCLMAAGLIGGLYKLFTA